MPGSQTIIWRDTEYLVRGIQRNGEVVSNGGFEFNNPPTGWVAGIGMDTFEQSTGKVHGGTYSAHCVDAAVGVSDYIANYSTLVINTVYKMTFWYYIVSGTIKAQLVKGDGSAAIIESATLSTTGSWQYSTLTGTNTVSGHLGGPLFYNDYLLGVTEFYIDDVSVGAYLYTINDWQKDFRSCGVVVGLAIRNITLGTSGNITAVTENSITADISFAYGDIYEIYKTATYNSKIETHYEDRRAGHKITDPSETINGILVDDVDVDEDNIHVFGPGQPER